MKAVIDANIGFKAIVPEDGSDKALKLRDDFRKGLHELLAPDIYSVEVGNSLVMAVRSGKFPANELPAAYLQLMANLPITYQIVSLFLRAFTIASNIRVSVYDALYLALSEREGCPLLTDDQKLIKAAPAFSFLTLDDL